MVSDNVRKYLDEVDPISVIDEHFIYHHCVVGGSYVFGGYKEGSDIDYLVPPNISPQRFKDLCYESGRYRKKGCQSFYVKTKNGDILNLLFTNSDMDFQEWVYATKKMREDVANLKDFTDKKVRVKAFQNYRRNWRDNNGQ